MRTTQKAFAALTAAATLIGLAACGGGSDNASKGSTGDANKAELVFWGWDTGHTMTNLIKDFQKANPGITVKFNNTGTAEKTSTALSNAIAAGNGAPDVVMLEDPTVTQFAVTGDLADLKVKSCDIEAWSPRQKKYFEVCSCSNLGDAQARRLKIRVKGEDGKMYLPHTLNNTVVAPPRMLIAFLENNLQADGSVLIPKVLQPYMGGKTVLIPKK